MGSNARHNELKLLLVISLYAILLSCTGCLDWSGDITRYHRVLSDAHPTVAPPAFDPAKPLPLIRALQITNADNESIASRGEDYVQALADKMRQAGTFLPTISIAPSYTLTRESGTSTGVVIGTGAVQTITTASGTTHQFTVPLDASATGSLANAALLQSAGRTVEQRAQLLLDERETILLSVVQSYYTALKAERQAAVYENSLKLKAEKVRDQQVRLQLGNVRPLDLAQTQADLAGTRASLTQAQTDFTNARSALARLMGVAAVIGPLNDAFDPPGEIGTIDAWHSKGLSQRQDLLAAARGTESARLSLDAAIKEYFPSVSINFSYFLYNDPTSPLTWTNAVSASIPIFSALSIEADIRKAWSAYRQAGLNESLAHRQVVDDVNENFRNLTGSRSRIIDLQIQVEAAKRAFDLSERAYQLGSLSNIDRLTQQDNLLTAELNLVSEQFNAKSYYLGLLRATGSLASILP